MFEFDEPYVRIRQGNYRGLDPATFARDDYTLCIRPDGLYGVGRAFGEALGVYYAEQFGLSVVCLRIGPVTRDDNPTRDVRQMATWLSHCDLAHLVDCCLSAKGVHFEIVYGFPTIRGGSRTSRMSGTCSAIPHETTRRPIGPG